MSKSKILLIVFTWSIVIAHLFIILNFSSLSGQESTNTVSVVVESVIGEENYQYLAQKYTEEKFLFTARKIGHFLEFASLGFFTYLAIHATWQIERKNAWLIAFLFGLTVAVIDETSQSFSVNRYTSLGDIILDGTGVFCGALCSVLFLFILLLVVKKFKKGVI